MKIKYQKPCVLSIAGFDPSGGAGVLADVKTFEKNDTVGFAINTCITIQNEIEFSKIYWQPIEQIREQLEILFKIYDIQFVKIGLVESIEMLNTICDELYKLNNKIKIIWDPILKSSTGFLFHEYVDEADLKKLLQKIYLITPNTNEALALFSTFDVEVIMNKGFSISTHILLKGGHKNTLDANDILISEATCKIIHSIRINDVAKHGSGCVLSAAITANLANGDDIFKACEKAKVYINSYLISSENLLGFHL
jgi:hydroxymethylpyrimidine/phosphomethylpyrimidine kinase